MSDVSDPKNLLFEYLKNGASTDLAVDGSSTPVTFKFTVPAGKSDELHRLNLVIVDGGIQYGKFGGVTGLTTGCQLTINDASDAVLFDFTADENIKANEDWGALSGTDSIAERAAGDDSIPIRFTFTKSGAPFRLIAGESLRLIVNDDMGALSTFRAMVQGRYKTNS